MRQFGEKLPIFSLISPWCVNLFWTISKFCQISTIFHCYYVRKLMHYHFPSEYIYIYDDRLYCHCSCQHLKAGWQFRKWRVLVVLVVGVSFALVKCLDATWTRSRHAGGDIPTETSRQRPYHTGTTGSRSITEVKQCRARLVLTWVTCWEYRVLLTFSLFSPSSLPPLFTTLSMI